MNSATIGLIAALARLNNRGSGLYLIQSIQALNDYIFR